MQAERPCPFDMAWHQGILYLTTHTSGGGDESSDDGSGSNACSDAGSDSSEPGSGNGCLSLWDRQGRLVKVHRLRGRWRHPNGIRVFNAPR